MATAPQTDDKDCIVQAHCPTEELCRKAAQKLSDYCTTAQDGECTELEDKGEGGEKTCAPTSESVLTRTSVGDGHDPKPCTVLVETAQQIPLERGDTSVSFVIPPPPPSSPGDALAATHSEQRTQQHDNNSPHVHETPVPQPPNCPYVARNPLLYRSPPYTVVTTDPPPAVSEQPTQPGPPPTQVTNVNNTDVHQTQANTNVVVQNNIDLGLRNYPSYICFSITMFLLCTFLNPLALACAIPAVICSCVACSAHNYDNAQLPGKCALACNILALVSGIVSFILIVMPGIIVAVLIRVGYIVVNRLLENEEQMVPTAEPASFATDSVSDGGIDQHYY